MAEGLEEQSPQWLHLCFSLSLCSCGCKVVECLEVFCQVPLSNIGHCDKSTSVAEVLSGRLIVGSLQCYRQVCQPQSD